MLDLDLIKQNVPLHSVMERHARATLKPAGPGKYKTLCMFHDEKTPSLHVNSADGYYKCFGCGETGDVITFVVNYLHHDFVDAAQLLADEYGLNIGAPGTDDDTPESVQRQAIMKANAAAETLYHNALLKSPKAVAAHQYMRDKKLTHSLAESWGVGYAPGHTWLYNQIRAHFSDETLIAAGLVKKDTEDRIRDVFRERLLFSLRNARGQVLGFTGRALSKNTGGGKYINTKATLVYNKSTQLFGIDQAKQSIRATNTVIVVEGPTDALAVAAAGLPNVVACCGTALGVGHIGAIRALIGEPGFTVVVAFDGDTAGFDAAQRVWETLKSGSTSVLKCVVWPPNNDPNDMWARDESERIKAIVDEAVPLPNMLVNAAIRPAKNAESTPEEASDAVRAACAVLDNWADTVAAARYRQEVARIAGVTVDALPQPHTPAKRTSPPAEGNDSEPESSNGCFDVAREALRLITQHTEACDPLRSLPRTAWPTQKYDDIYHHVLLLRRTFPASPMHVAIDTADTFPHRKDCFNLLVEGTALTNTADVPGYAKEIAVMLHAHAAKASRAEQVQRVHQASDVQTQRAALQSLLALRNTPAEER